MTAEKRMRLVRMVEKIEKDKKYANKLGVKNQSKFKDSRQNLGGTEE